MTTLHKLEVSTPEGWFVIGVFDCWASLVDAIDAFCAAGWGMDKLFRTAEIQVSDDNTSNPEAN